MKLFLLSEVFRLTCFPIDPPGIVRPLLSVLIPNLKGHCLRALIPGDFLNWDVAESGFFNVSLIIDYTIVFTTTVLMGECHVI